jgi:hypothetical protein
MFDKKLQVQNLPIKILENEKFSAQKFLDFAKNKITNLPILTKTTEPLYQKPHFFILFKIFLKNNKPFYELAFI